MVRYLQLTGQEVYDYYTDINNALEGDKRKWVNMSL